MQSLSQSHIEPCLHVIHTVDPASGIAFPNTLKVSSKQPLPTYELVGVGVRTVSFLGIKVYSVGFYADLNSPKLNVRPYASKLTRIGGVTASVDL